MEEEEAWAVAAILFQTYGCPLETVAPFKYPGQILTATDDYWLEVIVKLQNARKIWARMLRVLGQEGNYAQMPGHLYLAIV